MSARSEAFFDTNVLLYLLSGDAGKAERAERLIAGGGTASVQALNEFASVASRKLGMTIAEIRECLDPIRELCKIEPVTSQTHVQGLELAQRYGFSIYDAMIVAAAQLAGCTVLYSEDLQDGQKVEGVRIVNPFKGA